MARRHTTIFETGGPNGHLLHVRTNLSPSALKELVRSLEDQWKRYRKQLRKCCRKASERAVHDLRVEARRLLSLLDLLAPFLSRSRLAKARSGLKCHLDTFDDLRDAQVQLAAVRKLRHNSSTARQFFHFLKKRKTRLCRGTRKHAKRLQHKTLAGHIAACRHDARAWEHRHGCRQAHLVLNRAVKRAFADTAKLKCRISPNDTHSIHCTRIAFKKYRYMIEALAGRLPWANRGLLEKMRHYQGMMGDIQDAQVCLRAFEKFSRKEETVSGDADRFTKALVRRRQLLISSFLAVADQLRAFQPHLAQGRRAARARGVGKLSCPKSPTTRRSLPGKTTNPSTASAPL